MIVIVMDGDGDDGNDVDGNGDGGGVDQLSLQELGDVKDDGEEEGGDDEGGQVERRGRGHLRSISNQYIGFNQLPILTVIVTFLILSLMFMGL